MNILPAPVLAFDAEIITWVVVGVVMFVGWLAKTIAENKQRREAQDRITEGKASQGGSQPSKVDELAARRRAQLQELARQRRGESAGAQDPSPMAREPGNLTINERDERGRAKAEYERRAAALRAQRAADQAPARPPSAEEQRREGSQREAARTQVAQRQADQEQAEQEQRQQQQRRAARAAQAKTRPTASGQLRDRHIQPQESHLHTVESPVAAYPEPRQLGKMARQVTAKRKRKAPATGGGAALSAMLRGRALRQAFVLKEILDRPMALRNDEQQY